MTSESEKKSGTVDITFIQNEIEGEVTTIVELDDEEYRIIEKAANALNITVEAYIQELLEAVPTKRDYTEA